MQFAKLVTVFIIISSILSCSQDVVKPSVPQIIPAPLRLDITEGQFVLNANTEIESDSEFSVAVNFLKDFINPVIKGGIGPSNNIRFIKDKTLTNKEGYVLEITPKCIDIRTNSDKGAFYAVQTLRQLLPVTFENKSTKEKQFAILCLKIEDAPRFQYRGMHLDVARHRFPVAFIKKYIDALAMLKMNTFHWHLTDDQGWRIEIKKYPKLNTVAAFRDETLVGHYSDQPHQFDGKKYGGIYTQEEVKDIVNFAESRQITVIPEIEMPGHSQAAIAAYPELGCSGKPIEVAKLWGVFEDIYCTKEETFTFLEAVLDEVLELFPSKYIHIGGDEAPKTQWKSCKECQQRIKTEGLKNEHELQSYFISRMETYLNARGRQIIGWDEILEGGLAPNATVMSWRGNEGAIKAAKEKHNVIMSPTSHSYFDYYQSTNSDEPMAIGGFLPLETVYYFNPVPEGLTKEEAKYISGAQGNVWTEYMQTEGQVEYMVFPRILAMSEVVWSGNENKDYDDFVSRVENFNKRLEALDVNYANHLYDIEGTLVSAKNALSYALKTRLKDKSIRYTLDGSVPDVNSKRYERALPITGTTTIKAAVFDTEKQLGTNFSETINFHKAVGKTITIDKTPHTAYSGSGANGLINGIQGSDKRFGDKEWLGFWGDTIEIVIDLGELTEIESIETRFYNGNGQWIYAPEYVDIYFDIETGINETILLNSKETIVPAKLNKTINTRFIKLVIPNYGIIAEGLQGAGNKAWTFIDEIIVK
jgi:hexosaminidase